MDSQLVFAIIVSTAALFIVGAVSLAVLVVLPYDYFRASRTAGARHAGQGLAGKTWLVLKNVLGSLLVLVGVILSVPLIPGPGLLVVAAGILLLDFPAKPRMLRKLMNRPPVLRSVNRLRRAFARPPLLVD